MFDTTNSIWFFFNIALVLSSNCFVQAQGFLCKPWTQTNAIVLTLYLVLYVLGQYGILSATSVAFTSFDGDRYQQKESKVVNNHLILCRAMSSMAVVHGQDFD